ncbi:recombinase family protein [Nonomuraea marmarensis]
MGHQRLPARQPAARHRALEAAARRPKKLTTTPGGRLIFHVFAALAEFIRELIVAGTRDGLAAESTCTCPPTPRWNRP